jgi:hypothetical protein
MFIRFRGYRGWDKAQMLWLKVLVVILWSINIGGCGL